MSARVLRFRHGAIPCAVPQACVRRVAASPDGPVATFWPAAREEAAERWLELDARAGARWIACSDPVADEVSDPRPLPPLVAGLVGLRHVVGWTDVGGEVVWLVDPARFAG